jgi:hypothetical protein
MNVADWLSHALADAEARGLPGLKPLLETLARSTQALRDADGEFRHPAGEHAPPTTPDDRPRSTRNTQKHDGHDTD